MKRLLWLFPLLVLGCKKTFPLEVIETGTNHELKVDKEVLLAIKFCSDTGRHFGGYESNDWTSIGKGYRYEIVCVDRQ